MNYKVYFFILLLFSCKNAPKNDANTYGTSRENREGGAKTAKSSNDISILIYGGIQYNADSTALAQAKVKTVTPKEYNEPLAVATEKITKRGGTAQTTWGYLPGTKTEIGLIAALFNNKHLPCEVKTGFAASEDNFKMIGIAQASPTILHIATHGYFFDEPKNEDKTASFQNSENPLIRSGLVMAGANKAWIDGHGYNNMEDGILTAFEIANLNLSKTKLVVLSACDTGLGDIQGTEGVYGLQRAFKMAGVDYILMSLWPVDDEKTAELMRLFYKNYLNGKPIREAFRGAQNEMKLHYAPYHWAGFVLIR